MKIITHDWTDIDKAVNSIFSDIYADGWKPDITVGISPSAVVFSNLLSNRLNTDYETIKINFEQGEADMEINCWLPELAFGVNCPEKYEISQSRWDPSIRKNILICALGNSDKNIPELIKSWESVCYPNERYAWESVWHKNVRFACLMENPNAEVLCDYSWKEISTDYSEKNVFPWEKEFWTKTNK